MKTTYKRRRSQVADAAVLVHEVVHKDWTSTYMAWSAIGR